jgi:putative ABC transport system substrate-binding protein
MTAFRRTLVGFLACLLAVGVFARGAKSQEIVIIAGDSLTYTARTISGAKRVVSRENEQARFHEIFLNQSEWSDQSYVDSVSKLNPDVILTVGSASTRFAQENFSNTPIVFSAVMYPAISGFVETLAHPGRNITGASLDIPADIQFRYFRKIIPDLSRIGVMYTTNTASLIPPSMVVAEQMGIHLVPIKIEDVKEIPRALDSLARTVDGIWSVADPNLFSPQSTKYILLNCLRKGLPFMGFSRYVVESGALFALDFDYKAIGRQAGDLVNRVIAGDSPGSIPVSDPDIIWFHYNEKTAEHLNLVMPGELVAVAKEVYR